MCRSGACDQWADSCTATGRNWRTKLGSWDYPDWENVRAFIFRFGFDGRIIRQGSQINDSTSGHYDGFLHFRIDLHFGQVNICNLLVIRVVARGDGTDGDVRQIIPKTGVIEHFFREFGNIFPRFRFLRWSFPQVSLRMIWIERRGFPCRIRWLAAGYAFTAFTFPRFSVTLWSLRITMFVAPVSFTVPITIPVSMPLVGPIAVRADLSDLCLLLLCLDFESLWSSSGRLRSGSLSRLRSLTQPRSRSRSRSLSERFCVKTMRRICPVDTTCVNPSSIDCCCLMNVRIFRRSSAFWWFSAQVLEIRLLRSATSWTTSVSAARVVVDGLVSRDGWLSVICCWVTVADADVDVPWVLTVFYICISISPTEWERVITSSFSNSGLENSSLLSSESSSSESTGNDEAAAAACLGDVTGDPAEEGRSFPLLRTDEAKNNSLFLTMNQLKPSSFLGSERKRMHYLQVTYSVIVVILSAFVTLCHQSPPFLKNKVTTNKPAKMYV